MNLAAHAYFCFAKLQLFSETDRKYFQEYANQCGTSNKIGGIFTALWGRLGKGGVGGCQSLERRISQVSLRPVL